MRKVLIAIMMPMLMLSYGCGGDPSLETAELSGTVTFEGKPLPEGEIRFVPIKDTQGPACAGDIRQGIYKITARGGITVGTHRVEIRAMRDIPGSQSLPDIPGHKSGEKPREQYLPPKYNQQSTFEITVKSGGRAQTRDFSLTK
jgi:hypothetical protein